MTKTRSDVDPIETKEWLDALASLIKHEGKERAQFILRLLLSAAEKQGVEGGVAEITTPYLNTIAVEQQPEYPGDLELEAIIEAAIRWNAIAHGDQSEKSRWRCGRTFIFLCIYRDFI